MCSTSTRRPVGSSSASLENQAARATSVRSSWGEGTHYGVKCPPAAGHAEEALARCPGGRKETAARRMDGSSTIASS